MTEELRSLKLIPEDFEVRPLALRYIKRLEVDHPDVVEEVIEKALEIAKEEGHMQVRAETIRKAFAEVRGISLEDVKRTIFPLRLNDP